MMFWMLSGCFIGSEAVLDRTDADRDGYENWQYGGDDCDDADASIHPGADEVCDGVDSDCGGGTEDLTDADGDGVSVCEQDCDDLDPLRAPDQQDTCDGIDNDCDGERDQNDTRRLYFADEDGDGFGSPEGTQFMACLAPAGYVSNHTDCDDTDALLSPDTLWYPDTDGDGFGGQPSRFTLCELESEHVGFYVLDATDCDDADAHVNPGVVEDEASCNQIDEDCDPTTAPLELVDADNDGFAACEDCDDLDALLRPDLWYADADGDGVGAGSLQTGCPADSLWSAVDGDCAPESALFSSSDDIVIDDSWSLQDVLDGRCEGTALTLEDGHYPPVVVDRDVVIQAESGVEIGGLDIQDAAFSLTGGAMVGVLQASGGTVELMDVELELTATSTLEDAQIVWEQVQVQVDVAAGDVGLHLTNVEQDSRLAFVQIDDTEEPASMALQLSHGDEVLEIDHLLIEGGAESMVIDDHEVEIRYATFARYSVAGLRVRGPGTVELVNSVAGVPFSTPSNAFVFESNAALGLSAVYAVNGATVQDATDQFADCVATSLTPHQSSCQAFSTDVLDAFSLEAEGPGGLPPGDHLYGRLTSLDDCHPAEFPGTGGPPDSCFQPGWFGGIPPEAE